MRILQVTPYFYPVTGGLERVALFLSKELRNRGHDVHVCTSNLNPLGPRFLKRFEVIDGIKIHRIPSCFVYHMLEIPSLSLGSLKQVVHLNFDVVHVHTHLSVFGIVVSMLMRLSLAKVIIQVMSVDTLPDHPRLFVRTLGPLYDKLTLGITKKVAAKVLARSLRDYIILHSRYGIKGLDMLPDGVPAYYFKNFDSMGFKNKYNISSENCILFIGRLHPLKGLHILLSSAPLVLKDFPDTTFVLIGPDGGARRKLEEQKTRMKLNEKIRILGQVSERRKLQAIASCNMLVLPTTSHFVEVYPMVISEAWAQKKPVVASSVGGVPYRVKHGYNGLLVKPRDHKGLAEAMKLLLSDKSYASKMGEMGASSVYTWAEIAERAEEIYESVC